MKYKVAVFDLDGTLVDTIDDLGTAVNYALSLRGMPLHTMLEYRRMVGRGVRNLVCSAMPEEVRGDDALVDAVLADFKAYYSEHIDVYSRPYDGIEALLETLRNDGVSLAVASNKFQAGAEKVLSSVLPSIEFGIVLGERAGVPLKPDPAVVDAVLEHLGCTRSEAVYVGDSAVDMKTAKAAGLPFVAVTWGFDPDAAVSQADFVAHKAEDILDFMSN